MSQISTKRGCFFGSNLPKIDFEVGISKNLTPDSESALPRHRVCQFSGKTSNFDFFIPNLPKNGFRVENSEN